MPSLFKASSIDVTDDEYVQLRNERDVFRRKIDAIEDELAAARARLGAMNLQLATHQIRLKRGERSGSCSDNSAGVT